MNVRNIGTAVFMEEINTGMVMIISNAAAFHGMRKRRLFGVRVIIKILTEATSYGPRCWDMSLVRTAICVEEINTGMIMIIGNDTGTTSIVVIVCADDTVSFVLVFDSKGVAVPVGCPVQGK